MLFFSEGGGRGQEERSGEGVGGLDSKKWPWLQIESEMLLGLRFDSNHIFSKKKGGSGVGVFVTSFRHGCLRREMNET